MNKIIAVAGVVVRELYRRKDFYVLFILTVVITGLMACMNFFHDEHIVRFIKEICLMLIWLSALVIAVTTAARQIPAEKESRTIFPLLAKPIARWQVLLGKFAGCWLATGAALVVFYLFFGLVSASKEHTFPAAAYLEALWLHWQMLGIIIAMTLFGSVILSTPAANMTFVFVISIGILTMGGFFHKLAEGMSEPSSTILTAIYFVIPHLEFFNMNKLVIHDWSAADLPPAVYVFLDTVYGLAYTGFFLIAACLAFRRKALN
jgi:ABC-type transport system involved in multi-copper enzyme maturation permease subunit